MLNLKYLFDNRNLAKMLIENWDYDPSTLGMFDYFRISANAVYPFQYKGKTRILRFAPVAEKDRNNLIGELEFIRYLKLKGYPALQTIPSRDNREYVEANTPWGSYFAVVFDRVAGDQLARLEYTEKLCRKHGNYLGRLHRLSSEYKPDKELRWSYEGVLQWIEETLSAFPNEASANCELTILREQLFELPRDERNFGLIHYDFELDNMFYDQSTDTLNIIDFDDAMYHWYAMDIEQALNNITDEASYSDFSIMKETFLAGYREEYDVTEEMLSYMPLFRRFANLYGYTRLLSSSAEVWDNEPEWLLRLRGKLKQSMVERSISFGKPIY